jgi:hypothetical protein
MIRVTVVLLEGGLPSTSITPIDGLDSGGSCKHKSHRPMLKCEIQLSLERASTSSKRAVATPCRGLNPDALGHGRAGVRR